MKESAVHYVLYASVYIKILDWISLGKMTAKIRGFICECIRKPNWEDYNPDNVNILYLPYFSSLITSDNHKFTHSTVSFLG